MDAVGHASVIELDKKQAKAIARRLHPIAVKLTIVAALVALLDLSTDSRISVIGVAFGAGLIGVTVLIVWKMRAATTEGLLQGADARSIRFSVTDERLTIENGPLTISREWDSYVSTSRHRGFLNLVARGGAYAIPLAAAPPELLEAIWAQLRPRDVPDPPPPPAFRRTYLVLFSIIYMGLIFQLLDREPTRLERYCEDNPGAEYWDEDGPHTC